MRAWAGGWLRMVMDPFFKAICPVPRLDRHGMARPSQRRRRIVDDLRVVGNRIGPSASRQRPVQLRSKIKDHLVGTPYLLPQIVRNKPKFPGTVCMKEAKGSRRPGTRVLVHGILLAGSTNAVWAGLWGIFFRKFFWDFVGGILRAPGGLQPSPKVAVFITIVVKSPVMQIVTMVLGFIMTAVEYPVPILTGTALHRCFGIRVVILIIQAIAAALFYQGTNAALYSFIAAALYIRALLQGECMEEAFHTLMVPMPDWQSPVVSPGEVDVHLDLGVDILEADHLYSIVA
ncbi:hypothetical protein M405DRAFT_837674 [Rhizopogon salebrosus TDB-379]|nr:hypothetical protein M405DRAFT_837674 [Rhizopogon salebrosus TDB-379]